MLAVRQGGCAGALRILKPLGRLLAVAAFGPARVGKAATNASTRTIQNCLALIEILSVHS